MSPNGNQGGSPGQQPPPDFIDHRGGNNLAQALRQMFQEHPPAGDAPPEQMRIATAFFTPSGFRNIADQLAQVPKVRLLFGAETIRAPSHTRRPLNIAPRTHQQRLLEEGLQQQEADLRAEINRMPFSVGVRRDLWRMIELIGNGVLQVRRYSKAFLHAKAYILSLPEPGRGNLFVGSSNFTQAGLERNLELNLGVHNPPTVEQAEQWFDELWEQAEDYDLGQLLQDIVEPWKPWDIYLRVLWQLYRKEMQEELEQEREHMGLELTVFQVHAAVRAMRLIRNRGGAIVADEVGLGKTYIAGGILEEYYRDRQRCLVVCPAALRDNTWRKFLQQHQLPAECLSYEQLAQDRQIRSLQREEGGSRNLLSPLDEYQLIIVDEAHNYRNPTARTRAEVLRRLMSGRRRHLLLLTATPVNNSLWDLHQLLSYFLRQDSALVDQGIPSLHERFKEAEGQNPADLSPDLLYPVIDATTVKRTRQFVRNHYANERIRGPDGTLQHIHFPEPVARAIRYEVDEMLPNFFDSLEAALNPPDEDGGIPDGSDPVAVGRFLQAEGERAFLRFARYTPQFFLSDEPDPEELGRMQGLSGLLRSALLKRFESSMAAFRATLGRMVWMHERFLEAMAEGHVVDSKFLRELSGDDESALEDALLERQEQQNLDRYHDEMLRAAVVRDLEILRDLWRAVQGVTADRDPKLRELAQKLVEIAQEAAEESTSEKDGRDKRKVLVFSYYEDTLEWVRDFLREELGRREELACYRGRMVVASGSGTLSEDVGRDEAAEGFAPESMGMGGLIEDRFDLLLATDVLAEGVNLQQCRHIINYDLPWNPMRLVQRHGRIDRIGSKHPRVFMHTVFPAERLDQMLRLQERIHRKLAQAARSVGVGHTLEGDEAAAREFNEARAEAERLLEEDPGLFERGGTASAAQTGEEYRQILRQAMRDSRVANMPWNIGSGMVKGEQRGMMFCAVVGRESEHERTYLRFVPVDNEWAVLQDGGIVREVAPCLRMLECREETPFSDLAWPGEEVVEGLWQTARADVLEEWSRETDPANLQPRLERSHRLAMDFLRENPPPEVDQAMQDRAREILSTNWPRHTDEELRGWLDDGERVGREKAAWLIERILATGLEPNPPRTPLPPIQADDIELLCWMGFAPEAA